MIGSFGDYFLGTLEGAPGHFPVDGRFVGVPNGGNKILLTVLGQRLLFPGALGAPGHFPVDGRFSGVPNFGNKILLGVLGQRLLFPGALGALGAPGHFPVDGVFLGGVEGFIADMITLFLV